MSHGHYANDSRLGFGIMSAFFFLERVHEHYFDNDARIIEGVVTNVIISVTSLFHSCNEPCVFEHAKLLLVQQSSAVAECVFSTA